MKPERFFGAVAIAPFECLFEQLLVHSPGHFFLFKLVDLQIAAIRCSSCEVDVVLGSRELVETIWLEWSMRACSS